MDFGCDEIKCINLAERTDKRKTFSKMMKEYEVPFVFFNAIKDIQKPSRGCFLSHAKIISEAYEKGTKRLMIFEDDACSIKKISNEDICEIRDFLDTEDWEIFFLGSFPEVIKHTVKKHYNYNKIYKGHFLAAGAYILNDKSIEKYKNLKWTDDTKIIDKDVYMKNKKAYATLPRIYMQKLIPNDINYFNSRKSSLFVNLRANINRMAIWYAINVNIEVWKVLLVITTTITVITLLIVNNKF